MPACDVALVAVRRGAAALMWRYLKRPFDVVVSVAGLLILSPLMALVAAGVWLKMGRPILFTQVRPGLRGRPFRLVKFRTMHPRSEQAGLSSDGERLTGFGQILRSTSLDELPELWNVLRGEMSLVGPRPLLLHYLDHYTPDQMRRHDVRPGLTGWAQVNGRNAVDWNTRLEQDVWYVEHVSFLLDLKILFLTVLHVGKRSGISAEGCATMPEFATARPNRAETDPEE